MKEQLRSYIDSLFEEAPMTKKTIELKEEILQNLLDKYSDLLSEGKSEEAAYNIAVASVGDVSGLIEDLQKVREHQMNDTDIQKNRQKSALLVSLAVCIYIISTIPVLLFDTIGIVVMLFLIAVATGLLIYNSMTKVRYQKPKFYCLSFLKT